MRWRVRFLVVIVCCVDEEGRLPRSQIYVETRVTTTSTSQGIISLEPLSLQSSPHTQAICHTIRQFSHPSKPNNLLKPSQSPSTININQTASKWPSSPPTSSSKSARPTKRSNRRHSRRRPAPSSAGQSTMLGRKGKTSHMMLSILHNYLTALLQR
jgi:hypothetical protein